MLNTVCTVGDDLPIVCFGCWRHAASEEDGAVCVCVCARTWGQLVQLVSEHEVIKSYDVSEAPH